MAIEHYRGTEFVGTTVIDKLDDAPSRKGHRHRLLYAGEFQIESQPIARPAAKVNKAFATISPNEAAKAVPPAFAFIKSL